MSATAVTEMPAGEKRHKDNILGICNAIGADFGFNPFFLRLAFAVALLASPEITLAAYAGLGVVVLVSRLATRRWRRAQASGSDAMAPWSPSIPTIRTFERVEAERMLEPAL